MLRFKPHDSEETQQAFAKNELEVWVRNFQVASVLAAIFVLAGSSLDALVYPEHLGEFFRFRLVCSALLLFIWWFVKTSSGLRLYRWLGLVLPALPTLCCSLMIYKTTGADSPYYAGLNLVLLGASIILRWTFVDSLLVFLEVIGLYLAACLWHGAIDKVDIFFNNIFTDLAVGQRIRDAQANVDQAAQRVGALRDQLKDQIGTLTERLAAMDSERRQLLTQ